MTKEDFFKQFKNQSYVDQLMSIPQKFNVVHDEETKTTNITIYGVIGYSWWGESFSATDIDNALNEAGDNDIVINLNSPGGDAFAGIAIYNRLKRHEGKVTVHVDGWACSAASLFPAAADETIMGIGSMIMIHQASSIVWGTKAEMRKEAEVLEELEEGIIDIYMTKAKVSREEIREKVDAETWFSAKKAVEIGFATKAEGTESDNDNNPSNSVLGEEQKRQIMNELNTLLKTHNQADEPSPSAINADKKNGSINFLKKWR
ncbi:head maturation protease, ClpP-related [Bacillus sp. B-jedd]|uniref:head maturation protease, ClpP-related n=1 Tax=Bacillus sp. B-jedd TaxID=1476857 RepID=UPI000662164E|nr:head maturation protease, ClpP-related [Bacillus sp. B-jedd]